MLIPFFLIAGLSFAALHVIATELYLYWRYWWFDIPMHFYGGLVVVLGIFALASRGLVKEKWLTLKTAILVLLVFAISWEIYELIIGPPVQDNYLIDTATDLVLGLLGAIFGYYFSSYFYNSKI